MSQENVEVVRRFVEGYRALTPSDMLRFAADFYEADADYYPVRKFREAQPCHGIEEIARPLPPSPLRSKRRVWEG